MISRQNCLKQNISKWISKQIQDNPNLDESQKQIRLNSIQDEGNLNQMNLFNKLVINYEVLPIDFQNLLEECDFYQEELLKKCETFYGQNNCEKINNFTYAKKCPQNYIRSDLTKCKKNCQEKKEKFYQNENNANKNFFIIDHNCQKYNQFYLDLLQKFEKKEDCLQEHQYCENSDKEDQFVQACPLNFKKIAFLCVPFCMEEFSNELKDQIDNHDEYCISNTINNGFPIFDF